MRCIDHLNGLSQQETGRGSFDERFRDAAFLTTGENHNHGAAAVTVKREATYGHFCLSSVHRRGE